MKLLDALLGTAAGESVALERLQRDPLREPPRSDPRFDALLARHSSQGTESGK